jgi:diacylglycerol kinase (ATP)
MSRLHNSEGNSHKRHKNAVCIANPRARRALTGADELKLRLGGFGYDVEFKWTEYPMQGRELARDAVSKKADLVIAVGGDGTINEVACGLALSRVPLAVIPCGTANVLAREIRLPRRMDEVIDLIPRLQPCRIALGKGGGRYFVLMAGVGIDAHIVYNLHAALKRKFGVVGFWLGGLRYWASYRFSSFSANIDGTHFRATFGIMGRAAWYGGGVKITSGAELAADSFDVCLFQGRSRLAYLRYLFGVLTGTHRRFHDVVYMRGKRVEIASEVPIRVQMDGEAVGVLPMTFEIIPDALTLMVPPPRRR